MASPLYAVAAQIGGGEIDEAENAPQLQLFRSERIVFGR